VSWMGRKRVRWWAALLLPALVLRSLIPLGFMPMFGPGLGVQFVLCEGYAPVPGTTPSTSSMAMAMPMDGVPSAVANSSTDGSDHARQTDAPLVDGGAPDHQDHGTCPYGTAPALGGLPALAVALVSDQPVAAPVVAAAQVAYFQISPRAQSSRGPPA
jgi:hypothetical protein